MSKLSASPSDNTSQSIPIPPDLPRALNRIVLEDLRLLTVAIAVFFSVYGAIELFNLPHHVLAPILISDGLMICSAIVLRIMLGRDIIPNRFANPLSVIFGGAILANVLFCFSLLGDPFMSYYVLIIVIGVTYFVLSLRWWIVAVVAYTIAWAPVAGRVTSAEDFTNFLFAMLASITLSATIQTARLRAYRRIESLRYQDRLRKEQLELALASSRREIIERRRAEEEKQALEEQLRQTQKMEAIGRLAGGVAHDMNNVLGAIMGSASVLSNETGSKNPISEDVKNILSACLKGRDLTRDLLGFAHKGKYVNENVSLNRIAQKTRALLARTFPKKITVELLLDSELKPVEGDPSQIEHALMNVCINASDAMQGEGTLTIATNNAVLSPGRDARLKQLPLGNFVELRVADTGAGMGRETLKMVFEPFFTTKPKGKGTGLGLSMVYGAIKNHGGAVYLDSRPGEGTVVTFLLPAAPLQKNLEHKKRRDTPVTYTGSGGVLLVDDEQIVRNSSKRLLERMGFSVFLAEDGNSAVDIYKTHRNSIVLVLLDQIMPVMDGNETFHALRKLDPEVKVLLCSGYAKDERIEQLLDQGACGFVEKPFDMQSLSRELSRVLE